MSRTYNHGHGRCNVCTPKRLSLPFFAYKEGVWDERKSRVKYKGMKKQMRRFLREEMLGII